MTSTITCLPLEQLMATHRATINPSAYPDEVFELFSIPAYDNRTPEMLHGSQIGSAKKAVQRGDVLLSRIVPHLRRAWVVPKSTGKRQIASAEWIVFRGAQFNPSYLRHFLMSDLFHVQFMNTVAGVGGSLLRARPVFVGKIEIPLPPLPEQKRIAGILDKADDIRRKRIAMASALDNLRLSQFDEWFSPWFESAAEQDYVPVSHFVSRFEGGLNIATPEKPTPETRHFILKVSAVTWGDYRPEESKPLPPDYDPPEAHFVRKGDLLFSRANTTELVGATVFVFETPSDRILPDKIWRFVWKNRDAVEPLFVWALFNHPRIRYEIGRRATGTSGSMKNISIKKVMAITVPWPDVAIQRRFARFMTSERVLRSTLLASKNDSDTLFNSLVQRAFRGQL